MASRSHSQDNDTTVMLSDLLRALGETGQNDLHKQVADTLIALKSSPEGREAMEAADRYYNTRQYADIHYSRLTITTPDAPEPAVLQGLSPAACKVLLLMATWAKRQYIQISRQTLEILTGLSHITMTKALAELREAGALTVAKAAAQHKPPIYRLSSAIVCTGKQKTTKSDSEAAKAALHGIPIVAAVDIVICKDDPEVLGGSYAAVKLAQPKEDDTKKEPPVSSSSSSSINVTENCSSKSTTKPAKSQSSLPTSADDMQLPWNWKDDSNARQMAMDMDGHIYTEEGPWYAADKQ